MKKITGFTLIELMVVIAIIGILASIALPSYQNYAKRAHALEGISLATMAKSAIWDYWSLNGAFPSDSSAVSFPSTISSNSVNSIKITKNTITITYNQKVTQGGTIILIASENNSGSLTWDCTAGSLKDVYRPMECR